MCARPSCQSVVLPWAFKTIWLALRQSVAVDPDAQTVWLALCGVRSASCLATSHHISRVEERIISAENVVIRRRLGPWIVARGHAKIDN